MKLQKHFAYKYKDRKYYKHVIVVPDEVVRKLGWNPGIPLQQVIKEGQLLIQPITQSNPKMKKNMTRPSTDMEEK